MSMPDYNALTVDQKRELARELRPTTKVRDLAAMLHVRKAKILEWTRDLKVDLRIQSKPPQESTERCECDLPAFDARFDRYCHRHVTCIWCGRVAPRKGAAEVVR